MKACNTKCGTQLIFCPLLTYHKSSQIVSRWALSRKNTASSHEQIPPQQNFIMIYGSIIHTSTRRTPVAAWLLGNTLVCTQHAALAGIADISLEWSVSQRAERSMPHLQCQPLPSWNQCCKLSVDITWRERQREKAVLLPFPGSVPFHTSWPGENSSEFSICIVTWAAAGGGMGIRKEKDRTEGRKTRTEEESSVGKEISGKCTQSLLLLYCLKLREEQKFLHRSAACCFVHLGFAKCIAIYKLQIWYLHVKDRGFT